MISIKEKEAAALNAVKLISNHTIIGLGSGSTMGFFTKGLANRIKDEKLDIKAVCTSYESQFLAYEHNIFVVSPQNISEIDLTVDGVDEIDKQGNAIKGKGGAHTLEKIIASMSKYFVLIADETKLVETLGKNCPVPIEIIPQAVRLVEHRLKSLGCDMTIRSSGGKAGPVITDLGNIIIDAKFEEIKEPEELNNQFNSIPGVIGHGLFIKMANRVIAGIVEDEEIKIKTIEYR